MKHATSRFADAPQFWREARRRRNHFFLVAFGWLLAGMPLVLLYAAILPVSEGSMVPGIAALATWMALWWWVNKRLTDMRCFRCGKQAFSNAYFFMRHAKCKNCEVAYETDNGGVARNSRP